jgi:acyl dehydratase
VPGLDDLIGTTFGPFPVDTTRDRAAAFVGAIGDDPDRWSGEIHPMMANVALFSAAPDLLSAETVLPFTRSLIHSEQTFEWHRSLPVGADVSVTGTVEVVRVRGSLNFVTFRVDAMSQGLPWLSGSSVFLMSDEAAAGAEGSVEPEESDRPVVDGPAGRLDLPEAGGAMEPLACGASRVDLMRYAAASGDWNPIHFDHDAARDAGLEGVIVHGLLMAAWMGRAAGRYGSLRSMRLRFRNPLRPAVAAIVVGSVAGVDGDNADLDLALTAADVRLVTARVSVTR